MVMMDGQGRGLEMICGQPIKPESQKSSADCLSRTDSSMRLVGGEVISSPSQKQRLFKEIE